MPHSTDSPSNALPLNTANLPQITKNNVTATTYDRKNAKQGIVHVGVGGFHRAHLAVYIDNILTQFNLTDWSICGVGMTKWDSAMRDALGPQDNLYTCLERGAGGNKAHVVGSITDYIFAPGNSEAVIAKMAHPDTHIVSMTITESGYFYNENTHELQADHPDLASDLKGEAPPSTFFGYIYEALVRRHAAGLKPFTVLSCDNMQKNGSISRHMVISFAKLKDPKIAMWIEKEGAFPNSMVDRITPRTSDADKEVLVSQFGLQDNWPVVCEPFMQWVLEDQFCDGRPPFEKVGVQVVPNVHEVEQFEMHKLRLLNASHSAIAYLAFLAGFKHVDEVLADPTWNSFVSKMMHDEVKPLLPAIPGVDLDSYCNTLMARFSNPTLKDEIARLCIGGSGKLPQFIMPSIAEHIMAGNPVARRLTLAVAAWFRYLSGIAEDGSEFTIKPTDEIDIENLQAKARDGGKLPTNLMGIKNLFGDDLRDDVPFMVELTKALDSLYMQGAKKTMESYA
jgi:mannitol 2-dehydrogenase